MNFWSFWNPRRANIEQLYIDYDKNFQHNTVYRNNWVANTLAKIPEGCRILDAGAGEQQYRSWCSHLDYVSQDFAQYDGQGDNKGLQSGKWDRKNLQIVCDIVDIPEPDASFDAIMCTEVFEHLPNPVLAIKEFSRLLRKGGHLIITAPFCSLTHQSPYHFYTGFNRYFYEKHLPDYEFDIVEIESNGTYFKYLAQEIHRLTSIAKQYASNTPTKVEYIALRIIINMLKKFDVRDKGSKDILNFGYHVYAIKR